MTCDEVENQIVASFDSPTGENVSEALANHLSVCPTCRSKAAEMRTIHGDLLAAANQIQTRSIVPAVLARIDARQHKSHLRRLGWAMAACLVFSVGAWLIFFATESVTLAQVRQALATQTWEHVRYDSGQFKEMWMCPTEGIMFSTRFDGDVVFIDDQANRRSWYSVRDATISVDQPTIYSNGAAPNWKRSTIADEWATQFDWMSKHPADCERHDETIDGRRLVRFDCYGNDSLDKRMIFKQLWIDAKTHLPVKDRQRLQLGERQEWGREWKTGEYDFPSTGPRDIYALGVPTTAPIVSTLQTSIAPQVQQLIERAKIERSKFPQRYRTVCWQNSLAETIDIIYRSGNKLRQARYFADPSGDMPMTEEKILGWAKTQTPVDIDLLDGDREYSRNNQPSPPATQPSVQVMRMQGDFDLLAKGGRPTEMMWPYLHLSGPARMLDKTEETPPDCIGFRFGGDEGKYHRDYYVDPNKGLACIKEIGWEKRGEKWAKTDQTELSDLYLLGGQWCPGKRTEIMFGDPDHGISSSKDAWTIATRVLNDADLPPDLFDGKTLMRGAKVEGY